MRRELEGLTFRRKIKEGPGHFLIFQIGGVFGICLDKWLRDPQVLVVEKVGFFLDEIGECFEATHLFSSSRPEGANPEHTTRRNDRKFEVVVSF